MRAVLVVAGDDLADLATRVAASDAEILVLLTSAARPEAGWLAPLLAAYDDPAVGAVGARLRWPGCRPHDRGPVGMLLPNGVLTRDFDAEPDRTVETDHLAAQAVSFRRTALDDVGGFQAGYRDRSVTATDAALRLRSAGWRLLHVPQAVVDLDGPPTSPGTLDDLRLLVRTGHGHLVRRHQATQLRRAAWLARSQARRAVAAGVRGLRR